MNQYLVTLSAPEWPSS